MQNIILCSVIGSMGTIYFQREKIYLHPSKIVDKFPTIPYQNFNLSFLDDAKTSSTSTIRKNNNINLWYFPRTKKVIIFCHGNAGNMSNCFQFINFWKQYLSDIYSLIIFDYIGFGNSSGNASIENCKLSLKHVILFVTEKLQYTFENILLYGNSLGGGIVVEYIKELPKEPVFEKIILQSTFSSLSDMAIVVNPFFRIFSFFINDLNTIENLKKLKKNKILLLHSKQDEIIPYSQFLKLSKSRSPNVHSFEILGSHNNIVYDQYVSDIITTN